MKQNYLNAKQRNEIILIYKTLGNVSFIIGEWEKFGKLTDEETKLLNNGFQNIHDFIISVLDSIDMKQAQKIIKDSQTLDLFCLNKEDAETRKKRFIEGIEDEAIMVDPEAYFQLAGYATVACKKCAEEDSDACYLKEQLIKLDVPVFDTQNSFCPYSYSKSRKKVSRERFIELFTNIMGCEPTKKEIIHFEYFRMIHRLYYEKSLTEALVRRFIITGVGKKLEILRNGVEKNERLISSDEIDT